MTQDTLTRTFIAGVLVSNLVSTSLVSMSQQATSSQAGHNNPPVGESEVSVVGCLLRADTSAWRAGTSGTTSAIPAPSPSTLGFVLKEATIWTAAQAPSGPVTTRSDREFGLTSDKNVRLRRYSNQQVEIKGWLVSSRDPSNTVFPLPPSHDGNIIKIDSVRTLSEECPPRR